jgi:hypothetical protein
MGHQIQIRRVTWQCALSQGIMFEKQFLEIDLLKLRA